MARIQSRAVRPLPEVSLLQGGQPERVVIKVYGGTGSYEATICAGSSATGADLKLISGYVGPLLPGGPTIERTVLKELMRLNPSQPGFWTIDVKVTSKDSIDQEGVAEHLN